MFADKPRRARKSVVAPAQPKMTPAQKEAGLLWTFTGLKVVDTKFDATPEGTYTLVFEDGRSLVFTAVGDDMTYCSMEIVKP